MSSSRAPNSPPDDADTPRTIVYDPNDAFWQDIDDDDDMDFVPAQNGSEDEDEGADMSFHGEAYLLEQLDAIVLISPRCCRTTQ